MVEAVITDAMQERMDGGPVVFSANINKMTRTNEAQQRLLVLTALHNIYLFDGENLNRKHGISRMSAIIRSTVSDEVVLIFPTSKDLRITGLDSAANQNLMTSVQEAFA